MRILESTTLTVLTTDTCTAACAHCAMNSSPTRRERLTAEQICNYVDQIAQSTNIKVIVFAGGEPLLLKDELYTSLNYIKSKGLFSRVVTNAYWATSEARAREITEKLRNSGLDELNISIDDYHIKYINPIYVKRAFDAALLQNFLSLIVVHAKGPTTKFNDDELDELLGVKLPRTYDDDGKMMHSERVPGETLVAVANNFVQFIGRGTVELRSEDIHYSESWNDESRALGGCPWAVRSPAISPSGHLLSCCGFEVAGNEVLDIGDLAKHSLNELLEKADNDLLLNMIAFDGPYQIMDFLKELNPELPFRERYSSFCELCQHIVSDQEILKSLRQSMHVKLPEIILRRESVETQKKEDAEFEALYHASDQKN